MGIKEEIEKILAKSKFLEKSDFIEMVKRGAESDPNLDDDRRKTLMNEKRAGDFWELIENIEWFFRNIETIKRKYPGQFVLLCNQSIAFFGEDLDEVIKATSFLKLEVNQCCIGYVPKPGEDPLWKSL